MKGVFDVPDRKWYEVKINTTMKNGVDKKEIEYDDLQDFEKTQVELGLVTFEQLKKEKGGNINGDTLNEVYFTSLHADSRMGKEEAPFGDEDFYFDFGEDEKLSDVVKKVEEKESIIADETVEESYDDLFS